MAQGRRFKISKWQAVIAAVIGAAGAVAAAVVPAVVNGRPPSPTQTIAISTVAQKPVSGSGTQYTFTGTSTGMDLGHMQIFVMLQGATPAADGGTWLVSPAASVSLDGGWHVTWTLAKVPSQIKWVATIYNSSCPSGAVCAPAPPLGKPSHSAGETAVAYELAHEGPGDVETAYTSDAPGR